MWCRLDQKIGDTSTHPSLLEMIALSAVQSFAKILIDNVILFINTSTILGTTNGIG